jgi:NTP pyrophosphatase (non-canonical NTP hydrolase)
MIPMSSIAELQEEVHQLSKDKGWYDCLKCDGGRIKSINEGHACPECNGSGKAERNIPEMLCLIHSEISEALEDWRKDRLQGYVGNKPIGVAIELADAVIRIMDLCEYLRIDLEYFIDLKHEYNKTRSRRHGGLKA